jgi:predicted permease
VAVISHGYWVRHFAADPQVVGRQLTVNRAPLTVLGVAPRTFFGERVGASPDVWIPLSMWAQVVPGRDLVRSPGTAWLALMGRLKQDVDSDRASAVLTVDYRQTLMQIFGSRAQPDIRRDIERARVAIEPAARGLSSLSQQFGRPLQLLMTAVAVVLLIACANIANLFLIRAAAMRRETSLRVALGITRARLFRGFVVESVLLAIVSAAAGLALGVWARDALLLVMSGAGGPLPIHAPLDLRLFAFVAAVAAATVVLFGMVPAWSAARVDPLAGIRDMPSAGTRQHSGPASLLVVGQVAASIVLLVGAGLIVRTVMNLRDVELGFASDQLVIVDVDPRAAGYRGEAYRALALQLLDRLGQVARSYLDHPHREWRPELA